jgi:hypothetical protein
MTYTDCWISTVDDDDFKALIAEQRKLDARRSRDQSAAALARGEPLLAPHREGIGHRPRSINSLQRSAFDRGSPLEVAASGVSRRYIWAGP